MEYIDFTAQRLHLHNNCKRAIVDLMKEAEVEEIDLLHKENVFGAAWLIRYFYGDTTMEEVQVTKIKLDGEALLYLKSASNLNGNLNCSKELEHYSS